VYILSASFHKNLSIQHIFTKETLNANYKPSEYAFQAEFTSTRLLSLVYPDLLYCVFSEAKEYDKNDQYYLYLDILVRNDRMPAYGYELVVKRCLMNIANMAKNILPFITA